MNGSKQEKRPELTFPASPLEKRQLRNYFNATFNGNELYKSWRPAAPIRNPNGLIHLWRDGETYASFTWEEVTNGTNHRCYELFTLLFELFEEQGMMASVAVPLARLEIAKSAQQVQNLGKGKDETKREIIRRTAKRLGTSSPTKISKVTGYSKSYISEVLRGKK